MEHKESSTSIENLEPNVAAAFTYLIPPITGVIFFLIEKKNNFVRFHALQSTLFGAAAFALFKLISIFKFTIIGYLLETIASLAVVGIWLFLLWKSYQNSEYELPVIGQIAKDVIKKQ